MKVHKENDKLYAPKKMKREYWKYSSSEETFNFASGGSFSSSGCQSASYSSNQIWGGANAYEVGQHHWFSITYTYTNPISARTYTFRMQISGQGNGYIWAPTVTVTYDDDTTEQVFTTGGGNSLNTTFTFTASKPIKKIVGIGEMTHTSSQYVGVYLYITSLTQIIKTPEPSTPDDYDYFTDRNAFYALNK